MGADALFVYLVMPAGKQPDWDAARRAEPDAGAEIDELKACWDRERRDADVLRIREYDVLLTGGMSWGDSPTDAFDVIQAVPGEALDAAGFLNGGTNAVALVFDEKETEDD